jgi:hypothetical protein
MGYVARSLDWMARYLDRPCIVRGGNRACETEIARRCGRPDNSNLPLSSCDAADQMDCTRVSHLACRSEYRRPSFPPVAGMDVVRSFCGVLRVVSRNRYERVSDDLL